MTPCGSTCQGWFNPVDQSCQQGYWPSGGCFFAWRDSLLLTVGLEQGPCGVAAGSFLTQHLTTMLHFNSDVLHRLIRDMKLDVIGVGPKFFRQRLQVLVANGKSPTLSGTLRLTSVSHFSLILWLARVSGVTVGIWKGRDIGAPFLSRTWLGGQAHLCSSYLACPFFLQAITWTFLTFPSCVCFWRFGTMSYSLPSRKLTYPPKNGTFEDDFTFFQGGIC